MFLNLKISFLHPRFVRNISRELSAKWTAVIYCRSVFHGWFPCTRGGWGGRSLNGQKSDILGVFGGESVSCYEEFKAPVGTNSSIWRGVIGGNDLPDLKGVRQSTRNQDTSSRTPVDLVAVSIDLHDFFCHFCSWRRQDRCCWGSAPKQWMNEIHCIWELERATPNPWCS